MPLTQPHRVPTPTPPLGPEAPAAIPGMPSKEGGSLRLRVAVPFPLPLRPRLFAIVKQCFLFLPGIRRVCIHPEMTNDR